MDLDAVVLADSPLASERIAGLSARERASRIAARAGADRTLVVDDRTEISRWRGDRTCPLLVIRADQLVHAPLVAPLVAAIPERGIAIAVGPDGAYAGAFVAAGDDAKRAIESLASGVVDDAIAAHATLRIPHGEVARHAIATADDRRGAHAMLYRLIVKPQDNVITRYVFRPVSSRITRMLIHTPITATQVSIVVAILVALGCWMTLDPRPSMLIGGALVILFASYLDCCDGEIARLKLQASTFGAWLDTIVDELSSIGYMVVIGWHCHAYYGRNYFGDIGFDPWIIGIVVGLVTYFWSLYGIYYNIIVAVGSGNSQDYTSRFIVVAGKLAPKPSKAIELPSWFKPIAEFMPNMVRRDFVVWLAMAYAIAGVPHISFATHLLGGVVSFFVVTIDHVHLRGLRRRARRDGVILKRVKG